jgi:glutamine ABC transporter, permease protein
LIIAQTYGSFEIWMTVAVLYLIMTMAISRIVAFLEKR